MGESPDSGRGLGDPGGPTGEGSNRGPGIWTEERAAEFRASAGSPIRYVDGRWWFSPGVGNPGHFGDRSRLSRLLAVWRPVDVLRPVEPPPLRSPVRRSVGYFAAVNQGANSTVPTPLIPDVQDFGLDRLTRGRRKTLRRSGARCSVTVLTDPDLLIDQGYDVSRSAGTRTGQTIHPSREAFTDQVRVSWVGSPPLVVAATSGGRLGGYLSGYAIGDRGYLFEHVIADWALPWYAGTALYWTGITTMQQGGVRAISAGPWFPEKPSLEAFKQSMGMRIVDLPVRGRLNPVLATYLRWSRPVTYRRLGGRGGPSIEGPGSVR